MISEPPGMPAHADRIRLDRGTEGLKAEFRSLAENDPEEAVRMMNDPTLRFSSLYLLQSEVRGGKLHERLSVRNKGALEMIRQVEKRNSEDRLVRNSCRKKRPSQPVLRWMLLTGSPDDGLDNRYDEVLEMTAIFLTREYRDYTVLPPVVDLLFERHRKGHFTYHLIWALFESRQPECLFLTANRLLSKNPADVGLARKLLEFVPCIGKEPQANPVLQHAQFIQWYEENCPYLYYTGESLQMTGKPEPFAVSLQAKYLCKPVNAENGKMLEPLTSEERKQLKQFGQLDTHTRICLAAYSAALYRHNTPWWSQWMTTSAEDQIMAARTWMGVKS